MTSGYIKLYRKIQDHPHSPNESACHRWAWIDLLLLAAYESHQVQVGKERIELRRGEIVASIRFLANRWGWSNQKTASFLARLVSHKQLIKIRNGSGNGSPSIYHIVNYDIYQGDTMSKPNGLENAHRTVTERLPNETKKGKKGKNKNIPSESWKNYLSGFTHSDQEILQKAAEAIAHTRKTGRLAPSILDKLANYMSAYPADVVLRSCQIYIQKNCAAEGKAEKYLMGILRGESKRSDQGTAKKDLGISQGKTEVDIAIENAMAQQKEEEEIFPWETL